MNYPFHIVSNIWYVSANTCVENYDRISFMYYACDVWGLFAYGNPCFARDEL